MDINYEAFDVFCSWENEADAKRADAKADAFEKIFGSYNSLIMAPAITLSLFSYPCLMASTSSWLNIGDATSRIVPPLFTKGNKPSAI